MIRNIVLILLLIGAQNTVLKNCIWMDFTWSNQFCYNSKTSYEVFINNLVEYQYKHS